MMKYNFAGVIGVSDLVVGVSGCWAHSSSDVDGESCNSAWISEVVGDLWANSKSEKFAYGSTVSDWK